MKTTSCVGASLRLAWLGRLALVAATCVAGSPAGAADAEARPAVAPPPIEDFVKLPTFGSIRFSPDGTRFAAEVERKGKIALAVVVMKTQVGRTFVDDRGLDVRAFRWLSNDLIAVSSVRLGVRSFDLNWRDFDWAYISIDGKSRLSWWKTALAIRRVPGSDTDIIIARPNLGSTELEVIDSTNGDRKRVIIDRPPGPRVNGWVLDDRLVARAGAGYNVKSRQLEVWARDGADAPWSRLLAFDPRTERGYLPVAIDAQGDLLVLSNLANGHDALHKLDRETRLPGELLVGHPQFDIDRGDLLYAQNSMAPVGVSIDAEKRETYWFDDRHAAVQRLIDKSLPAGRINEITVVEGGKVLVHSYSDVEPGEYYFYDPQEKTLSHWLRTRPWIRSEQMSAMDVVRYRARDGLPMFGYMTRPRGGDAKPPLLVWVHGGPHARDVWGFDADVQFFASRGYAVFQPNFRGSTGMGERFERAGDRQWGRAMQDDITDGVRMLIDSGQVDPSRICIGGGSYGGYAALMGVIREPGLFRCAIDESGPTDLIEFIESPVPDYNRYRGDFRDAENEDWLKRRIGNVDDPAERALLEQNSPRRLADRVKVPVMLIYGTEDYRVPLSHGTGMRDALRAAGARVEWRSYAGEGHGVWGIENRIDRLRRYERFLAEHLRAAPALAK